MRKIAKCFLANMRKIAKCLSNAPYYDIHDANDGGYLRVAKTAYVTRLLRRC